MRTFFLFKNSSNASYLAPVALAAYHQLWLSAAITTALTAASCAYHASGEKKYQIIDTAFALLLIAYNLVLCFKGGFRPPFFLVGAALVPAALLFLATPPRHTRYNLNHGMWHVLGSLITLCSILTYTYHATTGK